MKLGMGLNIGCRSANPELADAALLDKRAATSGTVSRAAGVITFTSAPSGLSIAISQQIDNLAIGVTYRFSGQVRRTTATGVTLSLRTASGGGGSALTGGVTTTSASFVDLSLTWLATQTTVHLSYNSDSVSGGMEIVEAFHSFKRA